MTLQGSYGVSSVASSCVPFLFLEEDQKITQHQDMSCCIAKLLGKCVRRKFCQGFRIKTKQNLEVDRMSVLQRWEVTKCNKNFVNVLK